MRFTCDKNLLNEAVNNTSKAAAVKSSFPELEGLLIEAFDNKLKITGYDLDLGIECTIEANVIVEGKIILNSKMFAEIVRKLPDNTVIFEADEKQLTFIKCDMAEYKIVGMQAQEYPQLPSINAEKTIRLPSKTLKNMIRQTIFAVSTSETKPIHTGSLFEVEGKTLKIISVDGFRLALTKTQTEEECGEFSFVVPGKTLSEISKILKDNDDFVTISLTKKHILFEFENNIIISRLLEGEFLNYRNVLPKDSRIFIRVETRRFIEAVERASLLINEKIKSPIRCNIDTDDIKITCRTVNGNVFDEVPAEIKGGTLEIGFNNRFMLDALRASEEEFVKIELNTHLTPILITPDEGERFSFLVLPVRLKNED